MANQQMSRSSKRRNKKKRDFYIGIGLIFVLLVVVFVAVKWITPAELENAGEKKSAEKAPVKPKQEAPKKPVEKETATVADNKAIDEYLESIGFSGTALVYREGKIVLNKGYKAANRDTDVTNTPDTVYYIGSSQKAVIATAILQLEEHGKLNVNDSVATYLPDFPNGNRITLRNLLNHTSGIVGHTEESVKITPEDLIKDIEAQGIKRQPGKWDYNDSNYSVLAYIVEQLSGEKLMTYVQKNIFEPAGMKHSGMYTTFDKEKKPSVGYSIQKDGTYKTPYLPDLSQLYGCGDMYMTATDMYLFDQALSERKLINDASFEKMFTAGSASGYGMGFYADPGSYNSHGILSGWNVSNSFSHSGKTVVVLLSNIQNNIKSFGKVNNRIYQLLNN
ncbi:class A beta-lactamase-related serine hydrolase [Listeria sp. SHR_NRA_18]|uniref:serine hydrolase domain-containing protein n=1 Tax=Listeria sp. SHR_NRA_18 TaxID=2269046 RepID=UPI000AE217C3|nr:serine hydrolase domain-containing protein [Listeria sp. SHR_NRA_18]RQW65888.1 class A beta-lactamase-related serine hydrolase [Listeria sp. SHR_NRA_18]